MTITEDRARKYLAAVKKEQATGKEFLLALWESGHAFRAWNDRPEDIAQAIGHSAAWVYDRVRLAGDYTRIQLVALIDKYELTNKTELWTIAYGAPTAAERTRRGLYLPPRLIVEADSVGLDIVNELKTFLSEVRLSELRAFLSKWLAEHDAVGLNA